MPTNKHEFDLSSASVAFDAVLVGGDACPDQGGGGDAYPDQGGGDAYPKREEEVWQEEEVEQEEEAVKPKLDFIGVARGDPPQTPIKSIEAKLKTSIWPRWT